MINWEDWRAKNPVVVDELERDKWLAHFINIPISDYGQGKCIINGTFTNVVFLFGAEIFDCTIRRISVGKNWTIKHLSGVGCALQAIRNEWAELCISGDLNVYKACPINYIQSGDSLLLAAENWGGLSFYDCLLERIAYLDIGVKPVSNKPPPIMMPNGVSGYICAGHCKGFFSCVEPNNPIGYICPDCRQ